MIKINLLAEGRRPAAVRRAARPEAGPADYGMLLLGAMVVLALIGCGAYWWMLRSDIRAKDAEIAEAEREYDELKPIIQEVEDFKLQKAELEHKIAVITDLKANQRGPVQVMDQLSRALPELLWLTRMEMSSSQIKLEGEAFNTNAIATFIENLEQVPEFEEPIPGETKPVRSSEGTEVFSFALTVPYRLVPLSEVSPGGAAPEEEAATAAGAG